MRDNRGATHHPSSPNGRTVADLVRADSTASNGKSPLIELPVLILHGTADKVAKPGGSQLFYDTSVPRTRRSSSTTGTLTTCSTTWTRRMVLADMVAWIDARLRNLPCMSGCDSRPGAAKSPDTAAATASLLMAPRR